MKIQKILCRKCGWAYSSREVPENKFRKEAVYVKVCGDCKEKNRVASRKLLAERNKSEKMRRSVSKRMRSKNPMRIAKVANNLAATLREKYRTGELKSSFSDPGVKKRAEDSQRAFWKSERANTLKAEMSERMKRQNPMFYQGCVEKVLRTRKLMMQQGLLVFPKGEEHWLWKGNRRFNLLVRSRLYRGWIFPILERDGFRCVACGEKKKLHVHHLRKLESIIFDVLEKNLFSSTADIPRERYSEMADKVVREHVLEDGVTVCKACHAKIDPQYKG